MSTASLARNCWIPPEMVFTSTLYANGLHLPKAQVISALQAAGLDERSRPEQLTLENYCALQTALANT